MIPSAPRTEPLTWSQAELLQFQRAADSDRLRGVSDEFHRLSDSAGLLARSTPPVRTVGWVLLMFCAPSVTSVLGVRRSRCRRAGFQP